MVKIAGMKAISTAYWFRVRGTASLGWVNLAASCVLGLCGPRAVAAETPHFPLQASELFITTNVWNVHLRFTLEEWQAMEPTQSEGMPGPGGMSFGSPPAGGPGESGPTSALVRTFLTADLDLDGKLSREEFRAVGDHWFKEWDKDKTGQLDLEQVRAGLDGILGRAFGGPGNPFFERRGRPGPPVQGAEGHRNGLSGAAGIDFNYVRADLEFEGRPLKNVAVRYKGNSTFMESRQSLKRSLKIELNRYVKGQKLAGQTKLNLHNNVTDASWMNEVLSYRLFRDAGVAAPRTAYAKVFLTVPGQYDRKYLGLYSMVEEVDSHFAKDRFGTKSGAIFKPVTPDLFSFSGVDWSKYNQAYDPKTELSESEQQRIIDLSRLVTSGSDREFSARIAEFINLEEFARFMSVTVWVSTLDSILMMGQNFYLYLPPQTQQFEFVPWDLDHSFGQFPMGGSQEQRENLSIQTPWRGANRFLERMFKNETFKKLYLGAMSEFSKSLFLPERFFKQVDELAAAIRPAIQEESEVKLARFDKVVAGEAVEALHGRVEPNQPAAGSRLSHRPPGFGPGGPGHASKPIKAFVVARARSVTEQLAGQAKGEVLGPAGFGDRRLRGGNPEGELHFGPGMLLARRLVEAFDTNKDGKLSREEFAAGFDRWFSAWTEARGGALSSDQLQRGIQRELGPFPGGPREGPGFGPPAEDEEE